MRRKNEDESTLTGPIVVEERVLAGRRTDGEAILVVLHPADANPGRRHTLSKTEHFVGRRSDLDLPLDVDSVSRKHARLTKSDDDWWLEDLQSTNGTFVNDIAIERRKLCDGDLVRFGEAVVKFLAGSNIERAYHEEIYRLSILDGLTGVHNKRFFDEVIEREVARAMRHGGSLALAIFDIDHFKRVNDDHGHLAGDTVLQHLCRRLRPRIRREDLLARIGGEEFACVLPETPRVGAVAFAEDLRIMVEREPFVHDAVSIPVTISIGLAMLEGDEHGSPLKEDTRNQASGKGDSQDLLRRADEQLYIAKNGGRNRVACAP